jgi:hypothetical protein
MAFDIQDTSYAGTVEAGYMITQATFNLDTVIKGCVYVKDGIKKSHTIPKMDVVNVLQPRQATPVSSGTYTIMKSVLTPQDAMAFLDFNPRDFESHWYAEQLSRTLLARELPITAENVMLQLTMNRVFEQVENGIWMGSTAYTAADNTDPNFQIKYWDGFLRKLIVDGSYNAVSTPTAITASNILAKFQQAYVILAGLKGLYADPKKYERIKFLVSYQDQQLYEEALTTSTFKNNDTTEKGINKYKGFVVEPLAGLPKDTFLVCRSMADLDSNLWVGSNAFAGDGTDMTIQMGRKLAYSELFFFKSLFKFDTAIAKYNEVIMHTTLTAATFTA